MSLISGYGYINDDAKKDYERGIDGLRKLLAKAKELGITLLLEIDTESSINTSDKMLRALKEIADDNLKVLLDTNAISAAKEDFAEVFIKLKDYVKHIHMNDSSKIDGPNIVPGKGELPMNEYRRILEENNYEGYIGSELRGYTYQGRPEEASLEALEWLKED